MVDFDRLRAAYETARCDLLAECTPAGHWIGQLSSSPLATAAAVSALALVERHAPTDSSGRFADETREGRLSELIVRAVRWLVKRQNADGGWGDTDSGPSSLAATLLVKAAFHLTCVPAGEDGMLERADAYIAAQGGVKALRRRYAGDKTFLASVLVNCALAGIVPWRQVPALAFERACLRPHPGSPSPLGLDGSIPLVVAVGLARYHFGRPRNPAVRIVRALCRESSLQRIARMPLSGGGYLNSVPLASFLVMSLTGIGRADHPLVRQGTEFLLSAVRGDGSWPIEVNLAVRNTASAINAMATAGEQVHELGCIDWLLSRQLQPAATGDEAGGWSWTDSGGAPDTDDTAAALLALANWRRSVEHSRSGETRILPENANGNGAWHAENGASTDAHPSFLPGQLASHVLQANAYADAERIARAASSGVEWLLARQNRDGGWPTLYRGKGHSPLDRSGADLTSQALRALIAWRDELANRKDRSGDQGRRITSAIERGAAFLAEQQRDDGSWEPLWFGNPQRPNEANRIIGTARVLSALRDLDQLHAASAQRGLDWLAAAQRPSKQCPDGGWGGQPNEKSPGETLGRSSVEETALAVEALLACGTSGEHASAADAGLKWLVDAVEVNRHQESSPIGFGHGRLWHDERLYPLTFAVAALGQAVRRRSLAAVERVTLEPSRHA